MFSHSFPSHITFLLINTSTRNTLEAFYSNPHSTLIKHVSFLAQIGAVYSFRIWPLNFTTIKTFQTGNLPSIIWRAKRTAISWNGTADLNLTLRPLNKTVVPYVNNLDPDETLSNSTFHLDPNCLTLGQHFHHIEALWKLKQMRYLADDNLFARLRVITDKK